MCQPCPKPRPSCDPVRAPEVFDHVIVIYFSTRCHWKLEDMLPILKLDFNTDIY